MGERAWRELGQCIISGGDNPELTATLALLQREMLGRRVWGSACGRRVQLRPGMGSAEAGSASEQGWSPGKLPHPGANCSQNNGCAMTSSSLICHKPLRKEKNLIVEMEAETSLRFQSNELGPHPVAN